MKCAGCDTEVRRVDPYREQCECGLTGAVYCPNSSPVVFGLAPIVGYADPKPPSVRELERIWSLSE